MTDDDSPSNSSLTLDAASINIGGDVVGRDKIVSYQGYTADEVRVLLDQIATTFQPRPFDGRCPYLGLATYDEDSADLFFGREAVVRQLVSRVKDSRWVFITGPSGSGKSSLARAGLIHSLKHGALPGSERWLYEALKPGRNPIDELARVASSLAGSLNAGDDLRTKGPDDPTILHRWAEIALKDDRARRAVILIDQFEETFTQVAREAERAAFLNLLTHAASIEGGRVTIVFAMRSDFVSNCAAYPQLNDLLNRQFLQVGAMTPAELVSAIAQPALRVGLKVEPELVAQIIADMQGEPGALPLVQFALRDLFDAQQAKGGVIALTLKDYLERGGIHQALERHADESFARLSAGEQQIARDVFGGLIQVGRGAEDTRRTALLDELVPANVEPSQVEAVVGKLADARLIITDERDGRDIVTIAHEKLIEAWPWLRRLVNENRDAIALQNQIAEDAAEWERHGRDASYLYVGARLANAQEQLAARKIVLGGLAQAFVRAAVEAEEANRAREAARVQKELDDARRLAESEKQRAEEQARSARRLRQRATYLIGALGIAVLLGVAAGVFGVQSNQTANANATLAVQNAAIANTAQAASTQAVAQAQIRATAEISANLQRDEAQRQSRISLARALAANSTSLVARDGDQGLLLAMEAVKVADAIGPDVLPEASAALYEALSTANFDRVLRGHGNRLTAALFSPDGELILTGDADGQLRLWPAAGAGPDLLIQLPGQVDAVNFSPDGQLIAVNNLDQVQLYRRDGQLVATLGQFDNSITDVGFSPNGQLVVAASFDGSARVWRIDGTPVVTLTAHTGAINSARFSPDGSLLVTASSDKTARLWRTDGAPVVELTGHTAEVYSAVFSPDGQRVLTAGWDKTARIWNLQGELLATLIGHADIVNVAEFSPDGRLILTASKDGTARLWQADGTPVATLAGHTSFVNAAAFSPDGSLIVTASADDTARLWRSDGALVAVLRGHSRDVSRAAFSPDGRWIVTGGEDVTARLWRIDRMFSHTLEGHTDWVNVVAYSPDGSSILTASDDGTARLWTPDGHLKTILSGHTSVIRWATFSQDGTRILTTSEDGTARLWRSDGTFIHEFPGRTDFTWTACLSPDGTRLVVPTDSGLAGLWRDDGTQLAQLDAPPGEAWLDCFSPDGQWLAARDPSRQNVNVWRSDGQLAATLSGHSDVINSVKFSPDSSQLLTASDDGTARLWRTDGTLIRSLGGDTTTASAAMFTPDGQRIITFYGDGTTCVWLTDGALRATLRGYSAPIAVSANGQVILTIDNDDIVRLYQLDGSLLAVLKSALSSNLSTLAYSRDARTLLLGGSDGSVQLWDTATGRLIGTPAGHTDRVWSASFNADGTRVVTASRDGTTRLWPVFGDVTEMLAEAQRRVGRSMFDSECQLWLGGPCE